MVATISGGLLSKMCMRRSSAVITRPAASMRSAPASAFVPSSVTTLPFTRTWPLTISCSAWRREAMPARAIIFCSRSCMSSGAFCGTGNLACPFTVYKVEQDSSLCERTAKKSHLQLLACGGGLVGLLFAGAGALLLACLRFGRRSFCVDRCLFACFAIRGNCVVPRGIEHAFVAGLAVGYAFVAAEGFAGQGLELFEAGQLF